MSEFIVGETLVTAPVICSASTIGLINPRDSVRFNVPIYQRLYAWTPKEIERLLDDLSESLPNGKDYYIGNITLNNNSLTGNFDVIDGQQRLTTLWLIGLTLSLLGYPEWRNFLIDERGPRLSFTARSQDVHYLEELLRVADLDVLFTLPMDEVNPGMRNALKTIKTYMARHDTVAAKTFSIYCFNQVKFIAVFLDSKTDLNKYFEDMNNRGLQLEAHHKIKADLLSPLKDLKTLSAYAAAWDGISQMGRYLEYELEGGTGNNLQHLRNADHAFGSYIHAHKRSEEQQDQLESIMTKALGENPKKPNIAGKGPDRAFAILSFPEFFLHCLKLYLDPQGLQVSLDDKYLLREYERYKSHLKPDEFLPYLFKCRVLFDQYFIRSIQTGEMSRWDIRRIKETSPGELIRESHLQSTATIQAFLNVSLTASHWLTETLSFVINRPPGETEFLNFLEQLDKKLHFEQKGNFQYQDLLNKGTSTARYWFFKLDYLLWKRWTIERLAIPTIPGIHALLQRINDFQFRDNRSVEHIEPRNPGEEHWTGTNMPELSPVTLRRLKDLFGNLALISISSNLAYSNYSPFEKREDFVARSNKWGIESLKLIHIYSYPEWTLAAMHQHQHEMLKVLEDYERSIE
jgi:Protein of unknown function DUF262/Protein of unknown function (DUF1524)